MDNEVTKLYENAGIKKKPECTGCKEHIGLGRCNSKNGCINKLYPEFTAEKQLKLLLFQINKGIKLEFKNESKTEKIQIEALTDSIAGLINHIWQDLTESEKAEIKEILK